MTIAFIAAQLGHANTHPNSAKAREKASNVDQVGR
jgi:hypothetical protein